MEGHPLHLIATDGHFLGQPVELDALLLAPGERADVLVQLAGRGSFRLLDLGYDQGSGHMMGGGGNRGNGPGSAADAAPPLLTIVAPARRRTVPPTLAPDHGGCRGHDPCRPTPALRPGRSDDGRDVFDQRANLRPQTGRRRASN